jgi:hypothetical protein
MRPSGGYERSLSRIPFDPREERVIDSVSRWMGVLGRFQVLAGGLLLLLVMGVAIAYGTTEALPEPSASDTTPPLVSLGEVQMKTLVWIGAAVAFLGAVVLRGGILLIDAADDLERIVHSDDADQQHLEMAMRRLRSFYRIEILLAAAIVALAVVWALPGWM